MTPADALNSFYAVLKTGSGAASVAVRAALGAGATSVISADDLSVESLPARPYIALRGGPILGSPDYDMQRMTATWWVYDDPIRKFSRIDALIALVAAAYPADDPTVIPFVDIRRLAVSQQAHDQKLGNRPVRSLPYQLSWR